MIQKVFIKKNHYTKHLKYLNPIEDHKMYLCFPKLSAGSKLSLTALEQHCLIELPAIMKMFLICTVQYSSPMWLWSYLETCRFHDTMIVPDSASQVEGPSICILNKFPEWYFCAVKLGTSLSCATGNKSTPNPSFSGGLQLEMPGVREGFTDGGMGTETRREQNCFAVRGPERKGPPLMKPSLTLSAGGSFPWGNL